MRSRVRHRTLTPVHTHTTPHKPTHRARARQDNFYLPDETLAEVDLLLDEIHNRLTITELTRALASGGPEGPVGEINMSVIEQRALANALLFATARGNPQTPLAAALIYTGQVVRDLREAIVEGDWERVEASLYAVSSANARVARAKRIAPPPAPMGASARDAEEARAHFPTSLLGPLPVPAVASSAATQELAASTLVAPGINEVVRVEQEAMYRRVMQSLVAAMSVGGARGLVGRIDASTVDVRAIAAAIDGARALGARTARARHLTALARLFWQVRTAVIENDWPAVESLIIVGGPHLAAAAGAVDASPNAATAGFFVPGVAEEAALYKSEAVNRRVSGVLRVALRGGGPVGDVGALILSAIDTRGLEDAIRVALAAGVSTAEARALLATAVHMRALRLSLLAGNWDRVGELLDYVATADSQTKDRKSVV